MTEMLVPEAPQAFSYSNLSDRPPGDFVSRMSRIVPGVREVMHQVAPFAAWWEANNRRALVTGQPVWAVLGDSLSQGLGASAPDRGWVGRLHEEPPAMLAGTAVVNLSFNGARVVDVIKRQLPALNALSATHDIAVVTLLIGNNDLMSRDGCRELPIVAARLLERVPPGTIVATQPGMQRTSAAFNRVVAESARRRKLRIVDFRIPHLRDFVGRMGADFFHPSDRGYAQMASVVREGLDGQRTSHKATRYCY